MNLMKGIEPIIRNRSVETIQQVARVNDIKLININEEIEQFSRNEKNKIEITSEEEKETKIVKFDLYKNEELKLLQMIANFNFSIYSLYYSESKLKILVVDDQKIIRENIINLIKKIFSNFNIENYFILDGSDGIDLLNIVKNDKEHNIKCIITDENMEYLNGSSAVEILRKLEENNKIKQYQVISSTANDDQETKNILMNYGVNYIISKPCTLSSLTTIFKKLAIVNE